MAVAGLADHPNFGILFEEPPKAAAHQTVIVHQQDRNGSVGHGASVLLMVSQPKACRPRMPRLSLETAFLPSPHLWVQLSRVRPTPLARWFPSSSKYLCAPG